MSTFRATVTPGHLLTEGEVVTKDKLNAMARPTVDFNAEISSSSILPNSIITSHLTENVLTADTTGRGKMEDGYVTAAKLAADAVSTIKILDENVTAAKLANTLDLSAKIVTLPVDYVVVDNLDASAASPSIVSAAHGQSGVPRHWEAVLRCNNGGGDASWPLNAEIKLTSVLLFAFQQIQVAHLVATASTVYACFPHNQQDWVVPNSSNGALAIINRGLWKIKFYIWKQ